MMLKSDYGEYKEEIFVCGKANNPDTCEDMIVKTEDFYAVIDGVTSKSNKLYEGKTGGRYAAEVLAKAIKAFDINETAVTAFEKLNSAIAETYQLHNENFDSSIQACVVIYSKHRKEIWNYGDCNLMINEERIEHNKKIDEVLCHLRSFVIQTHLAQGGKIEDIYNNDIGREAILPFLKTQSIFANADGYFGYPVLKGNGINEKHIKVYRVCEGDHVVLASDGYPKLYSSLEESEEYLQNMLQLDPVAYKENMQTKMLSSNNVSYDDRAYLSFFVK